MFRVIILSIIVAVSAADDDNYRCRRIMHPHTMHCCTKNAMGKPMMEDNLQECMSIPRNPFSCDGELCIAKKKGFVSDDGKIDKAKLEEVVTADFGSDKELLENIKKNCVNGDIEKFGEPEFCELLKLRHCVGVQILEACPDWSDEGDCKGTKELIAECKKLFS